MAEIGIAVQSEARRASFGRLVAVVICACAVYAGILWIDFSSHNAYWFIHVGEQSLRSASTSASIKPSLGWQSRIGYDGQYYFFVALDPRHAKDYMVGSAGYVYSRPIYPALARFFAAGSSSRLPGAMLAINLVAVALAVLGLGLWLRARLQSPWYALLYATYPGVIFCVARDLTEPLAYAFVVLAILVFDQSRKSRVVLSASLLALAGLTRETTILFVVVPFLTLLRADLVAAGGSLRAVRAWRRSVPFAAAAVAPLLAWRSVVSSYVHTPTQEHPGGLTSLIPFHGIASYWPWHGQHLLILGAVVVPTVVSVLAAAAVLRRQPGHPAAWLVLLNAAAFVIFLPVPVDVDYGSAGRAAIGVILSWIYFIPTLRAQIPRPRFVVRSTAFLWSAVWFLVVGGALSLPAVSLVIT